VKSISFLGGGARACFPDKTGLKFVERRFARKHRRHEAHKADPQKIENFEKLIAGNAFSKHFRRFLVTLNFKGVGNSK